MGKASRAAYMREYRRKQKQKKAESIESEYGDTMTSLEKVGDSLERWSRENLIVPSGHADHGKPMVIPKFGVEFLNDAMSHRESLLCIARKNGKSAIIAVYLLGRLCGSIRFNGYRGGVCSISREKASELWSQCEAIANESKLQYIQFKRSPYRMESATGSVDFLSADKTAGHASGFDDAIFDELGLLPERRRELVNGLRSSVSARNGRFIALSIRGDSPFTREIIERRDSAQTNLHLYESSEGCAIDSEEGWRESNPGIGTIKSIEYMRDESKRCLLSPADERAFRAYDLNQPYHPSREMICSVSDYEQSCSSDIPARSDRCYVGLDIGGSNSMTAMVVIFPESNRVETYCAFGGNPDPLNRGMADGVGDLYARMVENGELWIYPNNRVTPVAEFLRECFNRLSGVRIMAVGADRYRQAEVLEAFDQAEIKTKLIWRGTGASAFADGSYDVRAFQRRMLNGEWRMSRSLGWINAIAESSIRYDSSGNPALDKRRNESRIDILQSAVIAAGITSLLHNANGELQFAIA